MRPMRRAPRRCSRPARADHRLVPVADRSVHGDRSEAPEPRGPAAAVRAPAVRDRPPSRPHAAEPSAAVRRTRHAPGGATVVRGALRPGRRRPRASRCSVAAGGRGWMTRRPRPGTDRPRPLPPAPGAPHRTGQWALRVHSRGGTACAASARHAGRHGLNVYRRALASWYGPGLYGGHLGLRRAPRRRHARRGAQVAAVRHEGHPALPRPHRARPGRSTAARTSAPASSTSPPRRRAKLGFGSTGTVLTTR